MKFSLPPKGQRKDWLSDRMIRGLISSALALPYRARVPAMGQIMRQIVGPASGYTLRAEEQLAYIFPGLAPGSLRGLADRVCDNVGRTLIENYSGKEFLSRMAQETPTGPGVAALERASSEGRPVILVTGHFGNYEAGRASLVSRGFQIGGLYRPMNNPFFNEHYVRTMESFGGPVFPRGQKGTSGFVRHLKAGGMLVLLFDQYMGSGATLDFLGKPAPTALSAAELALRYDAELIPFYGTRRDDGLSFEIELEAPVPHADTIGMTQHLNESLGRRILRNPDQWFWIHRRWKPERQRKLAAATISP